MALSRYGGITGTKKISEDFENINVAFNNVAAENDGIKSDINKNKQDLENHENSNSAHPAQNIVYSGAVVGASDVKQALDSLKRDVNDLILGDDDSDPNTRAEVVAARGGQATLGDRLDASDSQLSDFANVRTYGAKGDGSVDDTPAFFSALNDHNQIFIPKGVYRIAQDLTIAEDKMLVYADDAAMVADGATITNNGAELKLGGTSGNNAVFYARSMGKSNAPTENDTAYHIFRVEHDQVDQTTNSTGKKVDGLGVRHRFGGSNTRGGRHAIQGNLFQFHGPTASDNPDRNYVGVQGQFINSGGDGGTESKPAGAGFGMSGYAEIRDNAQHFLNVTGCELNTVISDTSTAKIHSGLQIASKFSNRGLTTDAAVLISMFNGSARTWKNGILFDGINGGNPLGPDSNVITISNQTIDRGIYFNNTTAATAYLQAPTLVLQKNRIAITSNEDANIILGTYNATSNPYIDFRNQNSTNAGARITVVGGDGSPYASDLVLNSGSVVTGTLRPASDNSRSLGTSSYRWSQVFAATGTINTSDERDKEAIQSLEYDLAEKLIKLFDAKTYKWKNDNTPAVTSKVKKTVQKTEKKVVDNVREEINIEDGKAILKQIVVQEEIEIPVFDEIPVYDENGEPLYDIYPAKYSPSGELLSEEVKVQRMHRVPVMIEIEEEVTTEAYNKENVRTHFGFIAQDIERALIDAGLTTNDFAGLVIDQETGKYGLRYEQVLTLLFPIVKKLLERVEKLEMSNI